MIYHLIGFALGFALDLLIGDPHGWPHIVIWIGKMISSCTEFYMKLSAKVHDQHKKNRVDLIHGTILVIIMVVVTGTFTAACMMILGKISPVPAIIMEGLITWQCLAARSLMTESMKVAHELEHGTIASARYAVSMIVGRDTNSLDEEHVAKAAIETVAENTSDGVIAPMLALAIGGPILGVLYKTVNTMDSMIGYKNDKYMYFGRAAAKLDDVVNYIPARISAVLMIMSCLFLGKRYSYKNAIKIFKRDRYNHASPNSAQTESVCAGALGLQLAGDASYFGKVVKKPYIGDPIREVEVADIKRANVLMYATTILCFILCMGGIAIFAL